MTMQSAAVLIVEDDRDLSDVLETALRPGVTEVARVESLAGVDAALAAGSFDVALVDLALGRESGLDAVRTIRRLSQDTEVIIISGTNSIRSAIESYELSAFAFVQKPFELDHLVGTVARAVDHRRVARDNRRLLWELRVINEVNETIRKSLDPRAVVEGAVRRLMDVLSANTASARLWDPEAATYAEVVFIGAETLRPAWARGGLPRPGERAIATRAPVMIDDMHAFVPELLRPEIPARGAMGVPMIAGEELVGSISFGSAEPARFTEDDCRLVEIIAGQVAVAIQNARLHTYARAGKAQWEATFDAIAEPIAVFDRHGRLLRGNTALAAHLNVPVTTLRRISCDDIGLCGGTFPDCAVGRAAVDGCTRAEISSPDDQIFSVTTSPVLDAGEGAAVVQVAKNVTYEIRNARRLRQMSDELAATNGRLVATVERLKTTQAQLLQAEKLSAIGQLVAGVAHELNNPLTSVIGYAQLLHEELVAASPDLPSRDPADLAADLRRIAEESERAARIVRNLLAFARRQAAAREPQDLGDLAGRVLALRTYESRLNGVEVETSFAPGLPKVLADGGQLQQALLNLVLNAEQAMRGSNARRLTVATRLAADRGAVEISITDTGHGITEENLRRIFDPFFTTRDVGEGTGLGLSICYGIVRDHGGEIAVRSRVGEGTTFSLLLPARVNDLPPATVLVAHGDQGERDYIVSVMSSWGLRVIVAESAHATRAQMLSGGIEYAFVDARFVAADPKAWADTVSSAADAAIALLVGAEASEAPALSASAVVAPPFELRALRAALRGLSKECV
jgi:two-component system NtrC family sensor kinase